MPRGTRKLGTNASQMPLFPWDHTCTCMHECPLVPSLKLLETARSPRYQEALENWEQTHERCLCPHWTTLMYNQDTLLRKTKGLSRIYMPSPAPGILNLACILCST